MKRRAVIVRCGWGAAVVLCVLAVLAIAGGQDHEPLSPATLPPPGAGAQVAPRLPAYPGSLAHSPDFIIPSETYSAPREFPAPSGDPRVPAPTAPVIPASGIGPIAPVLPSAPTMPASPVVPALGTAPIIPPATVTQARPIIPPSPIVPALGAAPIIPPTTVTQAGPTVPPSPIVPALGTAPIIPPATVTPTVAPAGPIIPATPVVPVAGTVSGAPTTPMVPAPIPTIASVPGVPMPISPAAFAPPANALPSPVIVPAATNPSPITAPTIATPPPLPPELAIPAHVPPIHPSKAATFPIPGVTQPNPQPNPPSNPAVLPTPADLQPQSNPAQNLGSIVNPPSSSSPTGGPPPGWYQVGSDLNFRSYWDNGLWFETANKDWRIHLGGRFQAESVSWAESFRMRGLPPGPGGIPASGRNDGVGFLDDGMFFRRVRLRSDGVGYETIEYAFEVDFEQLNFITYDHMWVGMKDVPLLGTVRIGQQKVPQGMEMIGSDYHLTFLERSSLADAFWTLFAPGILVANNFFNNNVSFQTMFHRIQPLQFYTSDFGDGNYAETTRLTWTPVYRNEGEQVVHIGGSYQWRHGDLGRTIQPGTTGNAFADTQSVVRFRARPEIRDATGIGTGGNLGGDIARFVDTGFLLASDIHTISPEFLLICGRFSVQAEGAWAYVDNAKSIFPTSALGTPHGTPMFWGGYIETSYFLTGEHRGYDRRFGTFDRPRVRENAFLVRGEDGRLHMGTGAWQIAYRYSYLDLNDNGINGGQLGQHTFGLNWYLNDNTKIQFQYSNINRNVIAPATSGTVHGFGMLAQWYF